MKETVRRLLGKQKTPSGTDICVYCGQGHMSFVLPGNHREIWWCRRCNNILASVTVGQAHFTRAATRLERAEEHIRRITRHHNIIDPKGMNFPSPLQIDDVLSPKLPQRTRDMHYAMIRSEWEELVIRLKALVERHKARRLSIVASWDIESTTWGATLSFNPKDNSILGRAYVQAYGAESAEQLVSSLEKKFDKEGFLDNPDSQFPFFVSSDLVPYLRDKAAR